MKKCLIISYGPVPTPEHTKVEGGGLRCWGIAKGVLENQPDLSVTVAYHSSYKKDVFTQQHEGIDIAVWDVETIAGLVNSFDSVVVSYCMGDLSVRVADAIRPDQQLILDCYVPIYVEASARESDNLEREFIDFSNDVNRFAHVLRRGDLFLCASEAQQRYYLGVLSAIGRFNPVTYRDDAILITPYGIYRDEPIAESAPITELIGKEVAKTHKKILWFGGIYPWFDLKDLVAAVKQLNETVPSKLVIVGAKSPFNTHPDFLRKYDDLITYIKESGSEGDVVLQDWVDFNDRANWYLDSDLVVVINKIGPENELAWRTRLVDFTWANLPIITNGGDPLGERLIAANAAERFTGLTPQELTSDLSKLLGDPRRLKQIRDNLAETRDDLYWDRVTKELTNAIMTHRRATDLVKYGQYVVDHAEARGGGLSKVKKIVHKVRMLPDYYRKYGARNTYNTIRTTVVRRAERHLPFINKGGAPRVVVVSHQLDMSGAPFIAMDVVEEIRTKTDLPVEFYTFNPAHHDNLKALNKLGIKPKILLSKDVELAFNKGDVVVLNTTAHSMILKNSLFTALEQDVVAKLIWYVHEDEPELLFKSGETQRIKALMHKGKIQIITAAVTTHDNYNEYFGEPAALRIQPYKVIIPEEFHKQRTPDDFKEKLRFILPGTIGDGRKGQVPIFYAFIEFYHRYFLENTKQYREFELVYVGVDNDFLSRQLLNHAEAGLGDRFKPLDRMTKTECLAEIMAANVTICYSLRECLPLFVFEGMVAGHPILRNDCSGLQEQLNDGVNGKYLDSRSFEQIVETLESMLNKDTTSDKDLAKMSRASYEIGAAQAHHTYQKVVDDIKESFRHE